MTELQASLARLEQWSGNLERSVSEFRAALVGAIEFAKANPVAESWGDLPSEAQAHLAEFGGVLDSYADMRAELRHYRKAT
jgi:hypothetical protein